MIIAEVTPEVVEVSVSLQTRILAVVVAGLYLLFILELVRRHKLQERYTVIWFLAGLVILLLALAPDLLGALADLAGITDPNAALFATILLVFAGMFLNFSVVASRQDEQITRLAQEVARLKAESENPDEDPADLVQKKR